MIKNVTISGITFHIKEEITPYFQWSISNNGLTVRSRSYMALVLPADHKVVASIEPIDANGNHASIDGVPAWSSSSDAVASVTPHEDDGSGIYSADIVPGTALGTCQINVTADADLGSGVTTISGVLDVQVVGGEAVGFKITTNPPEPINPS